MPFKYTMAFWIVVSVEKSADNLMGVPLYTRCFTLVAFNILYLSLIFVSLITMCLGVFLLGFIMPGTLSFLDLVDYSFSHIREVSSYYLFRYFLGFSLCLSLSSFCSLYNVNVGTLNDNPEVS